MDSSAFLKLFLLEQNPQDFILGTLKLLLTSLNYDTAFHNSMLCKGLSNQAAFGLQPKLYHSKAMFVIELNLDLEVMAELITYLTVKSNCLDD